MRATTTQPLKSVTRLRPARPTAPPLANGDHLALPEFERRYEALPGDQQAELIEGIVLMTSPVSNTHGEAHGALAYFLKVSRSLEKGLLHPEHATFVKRLRESK